MNFLQVKSWHNLGMMQKVLAVFLISIVLCLSLTGCGTNPNEEIHGFERWELENEEYWTLDEGMIISEWINSDRSQRRFQLQSGEEILRISNLISLSAEEEKKGLIGIESMSDKAQEIVRVYYDKQGEMFDLDQKLDLAITDYRQCMINNERFTPHVISQEVMPIAQSMRYVVYLTAVTCPKEDHYTGSNKCLYDSVIFDVNDGSVIDVKELFLDDWSYVEEELATLCNKEDTTVSKQDILDVMDQGMILVFQDYLEVWFPYGTWDRQEFDKGFGLKYEQVSHLMQEWAIPAGLNVT